MTEFPIMFTKQHFVHKGGTKFYTLYSLYNASGKGIVVRQYGRVGKLGSFITKEFPSIRDTSTEFFKESTNRNSRGYVVDKDSTISILSADEMVEKIGRVVFSHIGASGITHVAPSIDVSKMREAEPARYDEDGHVIPSKPRMTMTPAEYAAEQDRVREEKRLKELAAASAVLKANPNFGRF